MSIELLGWERIILDLGTIKCIKDYEHNDLVKDEDIKERWRKYFDKLFNCNDQNVSDLTIPLEDLNRDFMRKIIPCEVKKALHWMKTRNVVGLNVIPIEVWKGWGY